MYSAGPAGPPLWLGLHSRDGRRWGAGADRTGMQYSDPNAAALPAHSLHGGALAERGQPMNFTAPAFVLGLPLVNEVEE